jgi:hypothetical protein
MKPEHEGTLADISPNKAETVKVGYKERLDKLKGKLKSNEDKNGGPSGEGVEKGCDGAGGGDGSGRTNKGRNRNSSIETDITVKDKKKKFIYRHMPGLSLRIRILKEYVKIL